MAGQTTLSHFFKVRPRVSPKPAVGDSTGDNTANSTKTAPESSSRIDAVPNSKAVKHNSSTIGSFKFSTTPNSPESPPPSANSDVHAKFVQKLKGHSRSLLLKRKRNNSTDLNVSDDEEPLHDNEEKFTKKQRTARKQQSKKLTPLEEQVVDLKREYSDTILAIQVGYKYKFFGSDAIIASKALNIMLIPGKLHVVPDQPLRIDEQHFTETVKQLLADGDKQYDKFAYCSVPDVKIHVHIKRLLNEGYKVGIVKQTEVAAIKAQGSNKSKLFDRKVTEVFTKATFIDSFENDTSTSTSTDFQDSPFIISIYESSRNNNNGDENSRKISFMGIQLSTGVILYDEFTDDYMRSELETRLLHIEPTEYLLLGDLSKPTRRIVKNVTSVTTSGKGFRTINMKVDEAGIALKLSDFYSENAKNTISAQNSTQEEKDKSTALLDFVLELPQSIQICLGSMIDYLIGFNMQTVFEKISNFQAFQHKSDYFILNGDTLTSLEIFYNQTDFTEKGTLFSVLDHTHTAFGQRQLKKWIGRPLISVREIEKRNEAITEIKINVKDTVCERLFKQMNQLPDLEKILVRLHYGKISRRQVYYFLNGLKESSTIVRYAMDDIKRTFKSNMISLIFQNISNSYDLVDKLLDHINVSAAKSENKIDYFRHPEKFEQIQTQQQALKEIDDELEIELKNIQKILRRPHLTYETSSRETHLISVKNNLVKNFVPDNWVKINGNKVVSRFRSPEVTRLLQLMEFHKEHLLLACDVEFKKFVEKIDNEYYLEIRNMIQALATFDCLASLAVISSISGYVKPKFITNSDNHKSGSVINVKQGRNCIIEQLTNTVYVPNDIHMSEENNQALIITGPNMGGKSSYVRQIALIVIMAQIGCFVPAETAELSIFDGIFTRMGAQDNLMKGESTFMVEMLQCQQIIKRSQYTQNPLIILDEIGRGTGTIDGVSIAYAILKYLLIRTNLSNNIISIPLILFITHYPELSSFEAEFPKRVKNYHMGYIEENVSNDLSPIPQITFLYTLEAGTAHRSYGLNVAKLAGISDEVIIAAHKKAEALRADIERRKIINWSFSAKELFKQLLNYNKLEEDSSQAFSNDGNHELYLLRDNLKALFDVVNDHS